ncbi:TPA: hypothetical protein QDB06_000818 [Burkholderia vietnamiensis]|nr:hypothetical protein [Burkholderia vietnamiensis]
MKNSVKVSSLTKNLLLKAGIVSQGDKAPVQTPISAITSSKYRSKYAGK